MTIRSLKWALLIGFSSFSVYAGEVQFCVINNAGPSVELSAEISSYSPSTFLIPVGTLTHITDHCVGMSSSLHPCPQRANKGCIVLETFQPGWRGESELTPTATSTNLIFQISSTNEDNVICRAYYPSDFKENGWPEKTIATVTMEKGGLACKVDINPVESTQPSSSDGSWNNINWSNVPIINKK